MSGYCTEYLAAYRSPHESPQGSSPSNVVATLKTENKKLRENNNEMTAEIIRLRQQLSYIQVAATVNKKRPPPIDLANIPHYHPYETRPSLSRVASAPVLSKRVSEAVGVPPSTSSSLDSNDSSSVKTEDV
tara:strand:+ start:420 stop:812 length:393 start_codon:yes stop_codon:yes gene_type:complete